MWCSGWKWRQRWCSWQGRRRKSWWIGGKLLDFCRRKNRVPRRSIGTGTMPRLQSRQIRLLMCLWKPIVFIFEKRCLVARFSFFCFGILRATISSKLHELVHRATRTRKLTLLRCRWVSTAFGFEQVIVRRESIKQFAVNNELATATKRSTTQSTHGSNFSISRSGERMSCLSSPNSLKSLVVSSF